MVAGHEADVVRVAERLHPGRGAAEFGRHADVDEIAGDRHVVGTLGAQVLDEAGEQRHVVEPLAPALPVDVAHEALEAEIGEAGQRGGRKVRVGDMRDGEDHGRPVLQARGGAPPLTGAAIRALQGETQPRRYAGVNWFCRNGVVAEPD